MIILMIMIDDNSLLDDHLNSYSKALLVACSKIRDIDLVLLLIERGVHINYQDEGDKYEESTRKGTYWCVLKIVI
jgi:hypothetical protein